jgi:hypothetical protein
MALRRKRRISAAEHRRRSLGAKRAARTRKRHARSNPYDRMGRRYSTAARRRAGRKGGRTAHRRRNPWAPVIGNPRDSLGRRYSAAARRRAGRKGGKAAAHRRGRRHNPGMSMGFGGMGMPYANPYDSRGRRYSTAARRKAGKKAASHRRRSAHGRFLNPAMGYSNPRRGYGHRSRARSRVASRRPRDRFGRFR